MAEEGNTEVTLESLDTIVSQINQLAKSLFRQTYPNGKPDWMPQVDWDNIKELGN